MKTLMKVPLELIKTEYIPAVELMEFGKFYYSQKYNMSNHLCVCGCGMQAPIPIREGDWSITESDDKFSVTPSLLHRNGCKSHYIITNSIANIV
jgi:hypothetical protein